MDEQSQYRKVICEILQEAGSSGLPIAFIPNTGNAGDCLINSASYQVLDRLGLKFREIDPRHFEMASLAGNIVLVGGGGGFTKNYNHTKSIIESLLPYAARIIVLPQTINGHLEFITALPKSVTLVCREQTSFEYLKSTETSAQIHLGCDMALQLDQRKLRPPALSHLPAKKIAKFLLGTIKINAIRLTCGKTLYAMRDDCEKTAPPTRITNLDLSEMLALGTFDRQTNDFVSYNFLKQINKFHTVHTNRLHVSIGALLLNKETYIYDNNYGKNRSVYLHSLSTIPHVRWMDNRIVC